MSCTAGDRELRNKACTSAVHWELPVVTPDILPLVWSAVVHTTRTEKELGTEQRATPLEALKAVTAWAAYQNFEEKEKGTLKPGKLADLVVLSDNPLAVSTDALRGLHVVETVKGGRAVHFRDPELPPAARRSLAFATGPGPLLAFLPRHTCC